VTDQTAPYLAANAGPTRVRAGHAGAKSHFSPGLAPHVEQRTIRGCSLFRLHSDIMQCS
jgi:hypothetical protein